MLDFLKGIASPIAAGISYLGQQTVNKTNKTIARETSAFNAAEADESREFNSAEALLDRQFQSDEAAINRDWQANLSNTAYQRAVSDMRAAGLNPALMFKNAGPAATTGGAMASGSRASGGAAHGVSTQVGNELGAAVTSALQSLEVMARLENIGAQTLKTKAETMTEVAREPNMKALTQLYGASTAREIANSLKIHEEIPMVKPSALARQASDHSSAYANYGHGARSYEEASRARVQADLGRQEYRNRNEFGQGVTGDAANSIDALVNRLANALGIVSPRSR